MQPLSPVVPAHLLKASTEKLFSSIRLKQLNITQLATKWCDVDFTLLRHFKEEFSPLIPITSKGLSHACINWHEGHLTSSKLSFLK